jgi:hypothetical protein
MINRKDTRKRVGRNMEEKGKGKSVFVAQIDSKLYLYRLTKYCGYRNL